MRGITARGTTVDDEGDEPLDNIERGGLGVDLVVRLLGWW